MKIGIITIYGNENFGNKLQNYALVKILENKGCTVETFINDDYNLFYQIKKNIKKIIYGILNIKTYKRERYFLKFNKYLNYSKIKIDYNKGVNKNKLYELNSYDYYVYGSDQIWNCTFEGKTKLMQGMFTDKKKNISFAASIGLNSIPDKSLKIYTNIINNFSKISVREEKAKEILEPIAKSNIEVILDPTLVIETKNWNKVIKKPKNLNIKRKYILLYFLGDISSKKYNDIQKIANKYDCDIINMMDKNSKFYACGPSEFLYLEKNAFLICTDSFHSSVFAFLFNRPFIVYDREQKGLEAMNSRIENLVKTFSLEDRIYDTKKNIEDYLSYSYKKGYDKLKIEREKALKFIDNAIGIKNDYFK